MSKLYGAVEAGGTKFICAVGESPETLLEVERFATLDPEQTVAAVEAYFAKRSVQAIGISSFGPIDYGRGAIGNTPKPGWSNFPLAKEIERRTGRPTAFETDVNGAALGEAEYGSGRGAANIVYFTVGTGIGGGAIVNGQPVRGKMHPEMGHIVVRRHAEEPSGFAGVCPFHGSCLEGLASGPAIEARWGRPANELPPEHPAWRLEAWYLAQACMAVMCILSPECIVLGGGVMEQRHLLPLIEPELRGLLNGYLEPPPMCLPLLRYPALTGALSMAMRL
jgi:fructokinase